MASAADFVGATSKAAQLRWKAHIIADDLIQVEIPYTGQDRGDWLTRHIFQSEPRVLTWGRAFECEWSGGVESGILKFYVPRSEEVAFRAKIRSLMKDSK